MEGLLLTQQGKKELEAEIKRLEGAEKKLLQKILSSATVLPLGSKLFYEKKKNNSVQVFTVELK